MHSTKHNKRYRYCVTRTGPDETTANLWRVRAGDLEHVAVRLVGKYLRLSDRAQSVGEVEDAEALASRFADLAISDQRKILFDHGLRFSLTEDAISITESDSTSSPSVMLPARLVKRGHETKLALPPDDKSVSDPDPVLLKLLAQARAAQRMILNGADEPTVAHYSNRHLSRLLRISWLAPDIVSAIVAGRHPAGLTGRRLLRAAGLPMDWAEQRRFLGFA